MKKDIQTKEDITEFITEFYHRLLKEESINFFFNHLLEENSLTEHLETIINFWEDILFNTLHYGRNAMKPHVELNKTIKFEKEHFDIWLFHFNTTIDAHFKGEKAELAKTRALSIATILRIKLHN